MPSSADPIAAAHGPESVAGTALSSAGRTLLALSLAELLAMSLWFTGTAVLPQLAQQWHADVSLAAWLTMAVQLGFVIGALSVAIFNLSDIFRAPRIFAISALAAAFANAAFAALAANHINTAIFLRFITGAFLAGVYPTGMKILAGWYREGRGTALGILIAALTVGSALPHGVHAFGTLPWRAVVYTSSFLALAAAAIVHFAVREGPFAAPQPPFHISQAGEVFRNRRLRLSNLGYLGHMWELYSMWGWIAALLAASRGTSDPAFIELSAFAVVAIGAVGCLWAGRASDAMSGNSRVAQRSRVTILAMSVSGLCCIAAALVFHHFALLLAVALVWGVAVIADSAQFSAIISEVSDQRYVGTALALQTALGFLLTVVSLRVIAAVATHAGWPLAALLMAAGPALGIVAMIRLRRTQ